MSKHPNLQALVKAAALVLLDPGEGNHVEGGEGEERKELLLFKLPTRPQNQTYLLLIVVRVLVVRGSNHGVVEGKVEGEGDRGRIGTNVLSAPSLSLPQYGLIKQPLIASTP